MNYLIHHNHFHPASARQVFVLNMTQDQLGRAPGFAKETWPEFTDERWNRGVHEYFELSPFWVQ